MLKPLICAEVTTGPFCDRLTDSTPGSDCETIDEAAIERLTLLG